MTIIFSDKNSHIGETIDNQANLVMLSHVLPVPFLFTNCYGFFTTGSLQETNRNVNTLCQDISICLSCFLRNYEFFSIKKEYLIQCFMSSCLLPSDDLVDWCNSDSPELSNHMTVIHLGRDLLGQ